MSKIKLFLSFFVLFIFIAACTYDKAYRYYLTERFAPKDPSEVAVLYEKPDREFIIMADLQARGVSVDFMRREAAKLGADAVIVVILGGYYAHSEEWADGDKDEKTKNSYTRIVATVIKYK